MKVAILTQYYPPEVGAAQARLAALARAFVARGHSVTVLTAMPSYPVGRIHAGYGGLVRREELEGVRVIRSFIYPTQKVDFPRRLANYFSFVLSSAWFGSTSLDHPDFLIVESPPLFLGLTGAWLGRLKRTRMIFNVSDLWPESAVRLGLLRTKSISHRLSTWLEGFCYRSAWLVTGQSREIVSDIVTRYPRHRTMLLSNGVDTEKFHPNRATHRARDEPRRNGQIVALYAGLHGLAQGLDQILGAAEILPAQSNLEIVLMGDGPEKPNLVKRARARGIRRIRFLDPRPHAKMPSVIASGDISIVPLARYIPGAVPSKLYEAMASGRPVIMVAEGEAASIVRDHSAGIVVEPGDVVGLARALESLSCDPDLRVRLGANGRSAAVKHFDRRRIGAEFVEFLEQEISNC